jgi:hypothetical protein
MPLQPQTLVSASLSSTPAPVRLPATSARVHVGDSLFFASDYEERRVPTDLSSGLSPRSSARGRASPARPADTALITARLVSTSCSARGVPLVPSRAIPAVVDLDNE